MESKRKQKIDNKIIEERLLITFPIFGYEFRVNYTDSIQKTRDKDNLVLGALKSELGEYVDGLHSNNKRHPYSYIYFTPKTSIGVIAHEVFHAIWRMFKYIGAKNENEIFAYHLSHTLDEILSFKNKIDKNEKSKRNI